MIVNRTKEKLLRGEVVVGPRLDWPDPDLVRAFAELGFDYFRIEGEHGPFTYPDVDLMVRTAAQFDITPMARVPANVQPEILHYLDRGCLGITVPHVDSRASAEAAVRAAKHYPLGNRGDAYGVRNRLYGTGLSQEDYFRACNESVLLIALIEDREGLEAIDDIVRVPGIDAIDVGPWDLRQSLGCPEAGVLQAACDRIVAAAVAAGKPVGVGTALNLDKPELIRYWRERGVTMFFGGEWLAYGVRQGMRVFRDAAGY